MKNNLKIIFKLYIFLFLIIYLIKMYEENKKDKLEF